ncbi:uncharacterized protein LOC113291420 [Papaver somniferum]|uniref:uncharacterized protein LOC113291420 n=1 Tax=Papaver somniferum TaxID=3469 RepID=UPI000E6F7221|nr:uncharacterized protein LOC113291420 [Papaver somniferum]
MNILDEEDYAARDTTRINHKKTSLNFARKWFARSKGQWLADDLINTEAKAFHENLFSEEVSAKPYFYNIELPSLSAQHRIMLEKPFLEDEVKQAVWDIIKPELMAVVGEFQHTKKLDWRLNCTNIILIPKYEGAVSMHNFRPISLIGGIHKIVSKLLADRLKMVLPSIISEFQGAFVDNRKITEGILIASELVDATERDKIAGFVVKVDLEKAFDKISWICLDYTLTRFSFENVWC